MSNIIDEISKIGIVPVIALDDAKDAEPLAKALCDGGLPCAEVTFRTAAAEESIRIMAEKFPEMLVGAGTVLTTEQVDRAVGAGAKFIVSPGLNPKVVKYCIEKNVPILPGTANPSDVEAAIELGLDVVKFFPAEAAGGINMIKSMAAPYTKMRFMPTGGINASNLKEYLDFNKIVACGGSWMVKKDLVTAGKFEEITKLTREAVTAMLGFELKHVGINAESEEEADHIATVFGNAFGYEKKVGNSSIFSGSVLEVMKKPYLGKHGHIAIGTNYMERAIYHLERQGLVFDMETARYDEKGNMKAVYLKDEIGGFAVHLVRK
ncbi:MAG: bifunctional 4-hydroxy-2-oxoglutarate aldolase/2-dehydro-3-deoxy-phosphogluconate aldolase [Roseburia sp.]